MGLSMGEIICHGGLSQPGHEKEHGPKSDKLGEYVKKYIYINKTLKKVLSCLESINLSPRKFI